MDYIRIICIELCCHTVLMDISTKENMNYVYELVFTHSDHEQYRNEVYERAFNILKSKYYIDITDPPKPVKIEKQSKKEIMKLKHQISDELLARYYHFLQYLKNNNFIEKDDGNEN